MRTSLAVLKSLPEISEFYDKYWNTQPFLVKDLISADVMKHLISADELAGLSLEEDVRSRIVFSGTTLSDWTCEHGPFDEEKFSSLPDGNWSLLVQDVEKNHPQTKELLTQFDFSPCWLIDDIMASYSGPGGGVGPHLDSYHVFLVQGTGKRRWKIGNVPLDNEKYIQELDLKILEDEFEGDFVEVEQGDVLYIPPKFAHSGKTLDESMTYSIGFLGPSLAEMLSEFGYYIEEKEELNNRYDANNLDAASAGEQMSQSEVESFRQRMTTALNSEEFEKWLREYFENQDN